MQIHKLWTQVYSQKGLTAMWQFLIRYTLSPGISVPASASTSPETTPRWKSLMNEQHLATVPGMLFLSMVKLN